MSNIFNSLTDFYSSPISILHNVFFWNSRINFSHKNKTQDRTLVVLCFFSVLFHCSSTFVRTCWGSKVSSSPSLEATQILICVLYKFEGNAENPLLLLVSLLMESLEIHGGFLFFDLNLLLGRFMWVICSFIFCKDFYFLLVILRLLVGLLGFVSGFLLII